MDNIQFSSRLRRTIHSVIFLQNKTLRSIQLKDLKGNQTCFPSEMEISLLPFSIFNEASVKNHQLTVQEMFAKHLLQLHGVGVDKARAVVDKVLQSTLIHLML